MNRNRLAALAGVLLLVLSAGFPATLPAQDAPTPARVAAMRPSEVVGHILADSAALALSTSQLRSLADLEARVRKAQEPRRVYTGVKPHFYREVPGMTSEQALRQALAILRYGQRDRVLAVLDGVPAPTGTAAKGTELTS
ncbi:MAG TPA: hypothetical protein VFY20_14555 [Gemmatimonadales bacterium]|nr:hypothetical protein [Gemmatimonadales bacterium]